MEAFIAVFRHAATASNYIGSIRWACKHLHLDRQWDTEEVALALRGARRRHARISGGPKQAAGLMTTTILAKVVALADQLGLHEVADLWVISWEFLFSGPVGGGPVAAWCRR